MIHKAQIIVLHTIKHGDTGMVVQCYSNDTGKQSVYFRAASKNKNNFAHLHRLNILDVVLYNNGSSLPSVREISPVNHFNSIRTNIYKNTIVLFLSELLIKSIKEVEANPPLYHFIFSSIHMLEHAETGIPNFHIHFLVHLSKMLGFMPFDNYSADNCFFNIATASFCEGEKTPADSCFSEKESALLHTLLHTPAIRTNEIKCSGELRLSFAKQMIKYLSHHLGCPIEIKSLDVLHEVFN